jgi:hypothetical protein
LHRVITQNGEARAVLPAGTEAEFRQIFFKPYRVIYRIALHKVMIYAVFDGRRNLQSLLLWHLLEER